MPQKYKKKTRKVYKKNYKEINMPEDIFENTIKMLNSSHKHFDHTPEGRLGQADLLPCISDQETDAGLHHTRNTAKNTLTITEQNIKTRCSRRIQIAEGTYEQHCRLDKFEPGTIFDIFGELKKCQEKQNWQEFSELILLSMDKITYFSELDFLVNYMLSAVLYDPKCGASGRRESIIQGVIDSASSNRNSEHFLKNLCCKSNMRLVDVTIPQELLKDFCPENTNNLEPIDQENVTTKPTHKIRNVHKPRYRCSRRHSTSRNSKRIKLDPNDDQKAEMKSLIKTNATEE